LNAIKNREDRQYHDNYDWKHSFHFTPGPCQSVRWLARG
jgi:hypothetical protein